ncbi:MAG: glycoside hydrolase family 18 protein [Tannerella sp.]|jgi:chitinase|nr:glycoside hydrolase family 18 protein [Tannerella sp.]
MKKLISVIAVLSICACSCVQKNDTAGKDVSGSDTVVLAYVAGWGSIIPDPACMTHINFAFGHVSETFNSVKINNESRLKEIAQLKQSYPGLKICLSIGGWRSGRFSEMAADETCREAFANDCKRVIDEYKIDGIDMDWEYPTSNAAGISSSPDDSENFTLLIHEIRKAIGKDKLLTLATIADARFIDFKAINDDIDFINVMAYDVERPPYHHSGLYRSEHTGRISTEEAIIAHIDSGAPPNKIVMGIPFYGHGVGKIPDFIDYKDIIKTNEFQRHWDDVAKAPYLTDNGGIFICCYEDPESIKYKCDYILKKGLRGAMYWEYSADDSEGSLRKAVYNGIFKQK